MEEIKTQMVPPIEQIDKSFSFFDIAKIIINANAVLPQGDSMAILASQKLLSSLNFDFLKFKIFKPLSYLDQEETSKLLTLTNLHHSVAIKMGLQQILSDPEILLDCQKSIESILENDLKRINLANNRIVTKLNSFLNINEGTIVKFLDAFYNRTYAYMLAMLDSVAQEHFLSRLTLTALRDNATAFLLSNTRFKQYLIDSINEELKPKLKDKERKAQDQLALGYAICGLEGIDLNLGFDITDTDYLLSSTKQATVNNHLPRDYREIVLYKRALLHRYANFCPLE